MDEHGHGGGHFGKDYQNLELWSNGEFLACLCQPPKMGDDLIKGECEIAVCWDLGIESTFQLQVHRDLARLSVLHFKFVQKLCCGFNIALLILDGVVKS